LPGDTIIPNNVTMPSHALKRLIARWCGDHG
jgi:hypothetical protein